jgi:hypothetical protein
MGFMQALSRPGPFGFLAFFHEVSCKLIRAARDRNSNYLVNFCAVAKVKLEHKMFGYHLNF